MNIFCLYLSSEKVYIRKDWQHILKNLQIPFLSIKNERRLIKIYDFQLILG